MKAEYANEINDVLDFWYAPETAKKWFNSTPEFDLEIKQRFESLWELAAANQLNEWQHTPQGSLALCIVMDQFPLNMFRGDAKSYQTEAQSIEVAKVAIAMGYDEEIEVEKVSFLYMPLMHSESLADQELCVSCFDKRALQNNLRFAKHHRDLIIEFGRFPHRNALLNRKSTPEEISYLNSKRAFTG